MRDQGRSQVEGERAPRNDDWRRAFLVAGCGGGTSPRKKRHLGAFVLLFRYHIIDRRKKRPCAAARSQQLGGRLGGAGMKRKRSLALESLKSSCERPCFMSAAGIFA